MAGPVAGKRIGLLSAWASRANGGVFEAVVAQAAMLRELGAQPVVLAAGDEHHAQDRWRLDRCEVVVVPAIGPRALAYAPHMARALDEARLDLLHLHGIWQYPTHAAGAWARRWHRPLVISPHGMFAEWITARNRWKKTLARLAWERRSWASASLVHALTAAEQADIAREMPAAPCAIVPNAAPTPAPVSDAARPPHALYLGRIHPKKNLPALIAGWRLARPHLPANAQLTIAGWGDDEGIAQLEAAMAGGDPSIAFVGTAFGSQKAALFDIARFLVLPSLSEGLPMAVLEAWASGTPTIMSQHCQLPEGFAAGAAIDCGTGAETIAAALRDGFGRSDEAWQAMADAARDLARARFGRDTIARRWEALYASLLSG
ncbi:MAG: glycosyltransferase [Erythrobacter sp.]|jgi:poly(glycerol-phosphate) alpha-glucosyltransferase